MKCHICDATLGETEVQWNNDHKDWDPCGTCQAVIDDVFEPLSEDEVRHQIEVELEEEAPDDGGSEEIST